MGARLLSSKTLAFFLLAGFCWLVVLKLASLNSGNDLETCERTFPLKRGYVTCEIWHWVKGYLVDDLRISRDFPNNPDEQSNLTRLRIQFNETDPDDFKGHGGFKIHGYISPLETGVHSFKVELTKMTAACSVELWISRRQYQCFLTKVLDMTYDNMSRPEKRSIAERDKISKDIMLLGNKYYYFEFLLKAFDGMVVADVKWKRPSSQNYVPVPRNVLFMSVEGDNVHAQTLPSSNLQTHFPVDSEVYPDVNLKVLPYCAHAHEFNSTKMCSYLNKSLGLLIYPQFKVYPRDETWFRFYKELNEGNGVVSERVANTLASLFFKALKSQSSIKGRALRLYSVEETAVGNGARFFLEMEIELLKPKKRVVHTSEYVVLEKGSTLCEVPNFQWTRSVEVYLVVSVKNLGQWVRHLIFNVENIYRKTGDKHFSLIIVDFNSEDMDIEEEVKKSSFKRIHLIKMSGPFKRSGGLQAGIDSVQNNNSIVMTIDMHMTLPTVFVDYVRKHTVQYKMMFSPSMFMLNKGYTEINYNGFWATFGYGNFAAYKSDWTMFGGFNTEKFGEVWGGEDWDILKRAVKKGFEVSRTRLPGLVHYHHSKTGMWNNPARNITKIWTL